MCWPACWWWGLLRCGGLLRTSSTDKSFYIPSGEHHMSQNIGVIGLGAMGRGMAGSLRRAGYSVHVCDVRLEAAQAFAAEGGVAHANPAELARHCEVVVSVVVNAAQTEQVLFGPHGAAAAMAAGSV